MWEYHLMSLQAQGAGATLGVWLWVIGQLRGSSPSTHQGSHHGQRCRKLSNSNIKHQSETPCVAPGSVLLHILCVDLQGQVLPE